MNNHTGMTIQFTRGLLQLDQISKYVVPVLDFPFLDALDLLYAIRLRLDEESDAINKSGYRFKYPMTTALNDFLQFLVPAISHPFVSNQLEEGQQLPQSGRWVSPMPALGIPQLADQPRTAPIPPMLLKQVFTLWLDVVVCGEKEYFSGDEHEKQYVRDGIEAIKHSVNNAEFAWQYVGVDELWHKRRERELGYRALRSLLASQFVMNQTPVSIDGNTLEWRLAREDNGLMPVTQPFQSNKGEFYAYTLNLTLRDMPGRDEPLLYMLPRLRRYLSKRVTWTGQDAVRVMIEYPSPLVNQLALPDHTIQIPARIKYVNGGYDYYAYIVPMLRRLIGDDDTARAVIDAKVLLKSPEHYIERQDAHYHVIYNTGMRPKPSMHPGLSLHHIKVIHHAAMTSLDGWVQSEPSLPVIEDILQEEDIKQQDLRSLMSIDFIKRHLKIWPKHNDPKPTGKQLDWQMEIHERFRLAVNGQPLTILLFADKQNGLDAMEFDVRSALAVLTRDQALPEDLTIYRFKTPNEFITMIDDITEAAWKEDVRRIQLVLRNLRDEHENPVLLDSDGACVALIQRPDSPRDDDKDGCKRDDQKKSALRTAFGSLGIGSQMIRRFPDDDVTGLQVRTYNPKQVERSRLLRAVSDMLITSLGMTYGPPAAHYVDLLGFDPEFAQQIVVEYWVRYRVTKQPKADFIAVVRQYANGYIEVILPDPASGQPLPPCPVYMASNKLQTLFSHGRDEDRVYARYHNTPDQRVLTFFQAHLRPREQPTLIVPQVGDWRSRDTVWFHDDAVTLNQVTIGDQTWDPSALANVRIVKMLADEPHNLRYWSEDDDPEGLMAVHDDLTNIPTIYSIDGRREEDVDIETLVHRSRVVEFAALMMQPDDDEAHQLAWCQIPHLSRFHPGWDKSAIVYPYPAHVMRHLIDAALWAVFEKRRASQ